MNELADERATEVPVEIAPEVEVPIILVLAVGVPVFFVILFFMIRFFGYRAHVPDDPPQP